MVTWQMCFVNLKEENEEEFLRLANILKNTRKDRTKKKLGRRITKLCMNK